MYFIQFILSRLSRISNTKGNKNVKEFLNESPSMEVQVLKEIYAERWSVDINIKHEVGQNETASSRPATKKPPVI